MPKDFTGLPWTCSATYDSLPGSSKQSQSGDVSKLSMLSSQKKRGLLTLTERRWWKKLRKTGRAGQRWRRRMAARDLCPQTSWKVGFKCYISWTHSHHLMLIIVQVDNGPRSLPSTSAPSPHSPDATTPHQAAQHRPTNQSIIYSNPHASKKPPLRALPRDLNEAILGHPGLKPVNRESLSKEMNEFLVQRRRAVAGVTLSDNIPYTSATSDYDEAWVYVFFYKYGKGICYLHLYWYSEVDLFPVQRAGSARHLGIDTFY